MTPQRLLILSALRHSSSHLTASQILEEVKESYPYLDISTVYRTLNALIQMRLVSATDLGGGESSYEWLDHIRHHHLICRRCDAVIQLTNIYLENLGAEIFEDYSFQADIDHMAIFGLCNACYKTGRSRKAIQ
tara:strand:- start:2473 stop:2871 length:399 start_codon:yes stop_codon:yes gene_type:complete